MRMLMMLGYAIEEGQRVGPGASRGLLHAPGQFRRDGKVELALPQPEPAVKLVVPEMHAGWRLSHPVQVVGIAAEHVVADRLQQFLVPDASLNLS